MFFSFRLYLNEFREGLFLKFDMAIDEEIHDILNSSVRQNGVTIFFF